MEYSKSYITRCINKLKEWDAPLTGWICLKCIDVREDDKNAPLAECDLCGCSNVRYVHEMVHPKYFESFSVGCICAGIMEGDILSAEERERKLRNRSKRKRSFIKHTWEQTSSLSWTRTYKGKRIFIYKNDYDNYSVYFNDTKIRYYKNMLIKDFLTAVYAAFECVDPEVNA